MSIILVRMREVERKMWLIKVESFILLWFFPTNLIRYACLNTVGVMKAMKMPEGVVPSQSELEKRDQRMAKAIITTVGLEPEKYRTGYTKVQHLKYPFTV